MHIFHRIHFLQNWFADFAEKQKLPNEKESRETTETYRGWRIYTRKYSNYCAIETSYRETSSRSYLGSVSTGASHEEAIEYAHKKLDEKLDHQSIAFSFLLGEMN